MFDKFNITQDINRKILAERVGLISKILIVFETDIEDGTLKKMLGCFCKQIVGLIVLGQKVGLFGVL